MANPEKYQVSLNGPLKEEVKDFLMKVKTENKWSYKSLGNRIGISEAFVYHLINKNGNVSTNTYYQVIEQGIKRLKAGDLDAPNVPKDEAEELLDHSYHLREGLQVTFKLPLDLSEREAERLAMFIRSLAH